VKNSAIVLAVIVLCSAVLKPVFADDSVDLAKLQPLSSLEQPMYEKIKDNASELHKFIVTRTYIRAVQQIIKDMNKDKIDAADYAKFPPIPEEFVFRYTVNFSEHLDFYNVMIFQGVQREE
jgi:hypothetical protein